MAGEKERSGRVKRRMIGLMQLRGKFNPDDVAELSYFMAFNMPTNRARRRKGRPSRDAEEEREGGRRRGAVDDFHFTAR